MPSIASNLSLWKEMCFSRWCHRISSVVPSAADKLLILSNLSCNYFGVACLLCLLFTWFVMFTLFVCGDMVQLLSILCIGTKNFFLILQHSTVQVLLCVLSSCVVGILPLTAVLTLLVESSSFTVTVMYTGVLRRVLCIWWSAAMNARYR